MMEGSHEDGNYLVRVRAQVMTRDDSTGGWVPMGAGGLSHVSVCKGSVSSEEDKVEYLIFGKRIADQTVVLSCTIKRDFQYNKVMPTFHHWRTGDKKFGLTFQTAADARAFDKGVRMAIEDLSDGIGDFPNFHDSDIGEDDVFMTLELPVDTRSSSGSSSFGGGYPRPHPVTPFYHPDNQQEHGHLHRMNFEEPSHFHRMNFVHSPRTHPNNNVGGYVPDPTAHRTRKNDFLPTDPGDKIEADHNSYVQLSKGGRSLGVGEHDYSYPIMDSYKGEGGCSSSLKKAAPAPGRFDAFGCQPPPRLPSKGKKRREWGGRKGASRGAATRAQCRHCLETFSPEDNARGGCEYAPDRVLACIGKVSCVACAQCMLYHCMADSEGDFNQHPCSCDPAPSNCPKRWTALALLSLFVPCLWCYLPLRACHRCGVRCGVCGGRHDPA